MVKKKNRRFINLCLWLFSLLILSGCGSALRVYLHPGGDLSALQKVAVIPLANFSNDRFAGERVTHALITELLIRTDFIVVEEGEVNRVLKEAGVKLIEEPDTGKVFDIAKLKKLKESLGVQAIFLGSVDQYDMVRIGAETYPLVTLNVRLVDVETGNIIWRATCSKKGGPSSVPFLTVGEVYTLPELTQRVCQEIVASLK